MGLGGGRKERRRRVCGAKMTEIRDGDTTSKGAATAARSEGETERSRAAEQRERKTQHQAAKADRRGKDAWAAQPRLHWGGWIRLESLGWVRSMMGDLPMLQNRNRLATLGNVNSQKKKKSPVFAIMCDPRKSKFPCPTPVCEGGISACRGRSILANLVDRCFQKIWRYGEETVLS